jgi:hypothetical protein
MSVRWQTMTSNRAIEPIGMHLAATREHSAPAAEREISTLTHKVSNEPTIRT